MNFSVVRISGVLVSDTILVRDSFFALVYLYHLGVRLVPTIAVDYFK